MARGNPQPEPEQATAQATKVLGGHRRPLRPVGIRLVLLHLLPGLVGVLATHRQAQLLPISLIGPLVPHRGGRNPSSVRSSLGRSEATRLGGAEILSQAVGSEPVVLAVL